ncbi:helix-turn-helix transcriptional regulator [Methylobacterium organophilum]|uniref:helix-turn-helix transcriptional regulator n=1 Tax=Methylobacterium organophilum TaxID=410 RepID=UPI001F12D16C|nr:helix-turn-helix transcriptional regulator [Methylobacterium organophilum]UMY17737.1 helix-turn-helix transcriptional regulator [Methylobacterium organophilum]
MLSYLGKSLDHEAMTDRIYEASVLPERWPGVLDMMADVAGGVGTVFVASDLHNLRSLNSASLDGFMREFAEGGWADINQRTGRLLSKQHPGFLLEEDVYTPREIEEDIFIRDFLRPRGLGWATGTAFPISTGDTLVFSIERRFADGPVPRSAVEVLDLLRPHLGRAAMLSARLQLRLVQAAVEALALVGLPSAILSHENRIQAANEQLQLMIPRVVRDGRQRVGLSHPDADEVLERALAAGGARVARSIPIPESDGDPAMVAHLVPIRGAAQDIFSGSAVLLTLVPVLPASVPGADLLQGLFDLTPAEARVARGIGEGKSIETIAAVQGVREDTVRKQLKATYAKTGAKGQVDLVRLVAGLNPTR